MTHQKMTAKFVLSIVFFAAFICVGCARTDGGAPVEICHGRPQYRKNTPQVIARQNEEPTSARTPAQADNTISPHPATPVHKNKPQFSTPISQDLYRNARKAYTQDGVLIPVKRGTPFVAIAGGAVIFAGSDSELGNTVIIRHPNEWVSVYAHAQSLTVSTGSIVKKGQTLGKTGQSGGISAPNLHLEVRHNNKIVSPRNLY